MKQSIAYLGALVILCGCSRYNRSPYSNDCILLNEHALVECKTVYVDVYRGVLSPQVIIGAEPAEQLDSPEKEQRDLPPFILGKNARSGRYAGPLTLKDASTETILSQSSNYVILHLEPLIIGEIEPVSGIASGEWSTTEAYKTKSYRTLRFATSEDLGRRMTGVYRVNRGTLIPIEEGDSELSSIRRTAEKLFGFHPSRKYTN